MTHGIRLFILISASFLFTFSCHKQQGPQKTDEKTFVQIYCDVVEYEDLISPQMRPAFVDSVLNTYGVTNEDFQYTVKLYSQNKKKWKKIFEKIVAELERRDKALEKEKTKVAEKRKTDMKTKD